MCPKAKRPEVPLPELMIDLPLVEGGYRKPWFVKGDDFRVTDGEKAWLSVSKKACWICGKPFTTPLYAMVGDAMSATIRVYREPPCHRECAEYAMQVCPFILYPNAKRRTAGLEPENLIENGVETGAIEIAAENPGEFYITLVSDFTYHHDEQVTAFNKTDVLEIQHWVGGLRQESIPDPIMQPELVPEALRVRI